MIVLNTTTRKLQIVLGGAVATNQLQVEVFFASTRTSYPPSVSVEAPQLSTTNGATAVDICDAPATLVVRHIGHIAVRNRDTASVTLTILLNDNGTLYTLIEITLAVNEHLYYASAPGWYVIDASGNIKSTIPNAISVTIIDAKGDLIVGSAADTAVRFAVGADNLALIADAAQASGVKWATIPTAGITDDAVTYAKIQNISTTDRVLGRFTAGAGNIEEITVTAAGRAVIDDADAAAQRTTLGLVAGGAGDIWAEKAGDTFSGRVIHQAGVTGNSGMATATGSLGELETTNNGVGAAMQAFHRTGVFAAYFGIDTDNVWKVGGWSMGGVARALWHEGNAPAVANLSGTNTGDNPGVTSVTGTAPIASSGGTTPAISITAASDTAIGAIEIAIQSEMETGTDNTRAVVPGRQHFHPGHPKAWVRFNSAGTVAASYNITSVTDNGTGIWTVNIATDFSSGNYCGVVSGGQAAAGVNLMYNAGHSSGATPAAGTFPISAEDDAGTLTDPSVPDAIFVAFLGDQA